MRLKEEQLLDMATDRTEDPPNKVSRIGNRLFLGGTPINPIPAIVRRHREEQLHTKNRGGTSKPLRGPRELGFPTPNLHRHLIDLRSRILGVGLPNSHLHGDDKTPHGALRLGATPVQAQVKMQRQRVTRIPTPGNGGTINSGVTAALQVPRLQSMDGKTISGAASATTLQLHCALPAPTSMPSDRLHEPSLDGIQ